jgi:hypothetical protein
VFGSDEIHGLRIEKKRKAKGGKEKIEKKM